jgi:hypothetical protein
MRRSLRRRHVRHPKRGRPGCASHRHGHRMGRKSKYAAVYDSVYPKENDGKSVHGLDPLTYLVRAKVRNDANKRHPPAAPPLA